MVRRMYVCAALGVFITGAPAWADWPNFRGPNHDGVSAEKGFRVDWKENIPLVWERDLGSAYSSFAAVGDRVFTCGSRDGRQVLFCLDAGNGQSVWENAFEKEYKDEQGDGTRATPTVADGRVYILGANGTLLCADAGTGKTLWSKEYHGRPQWGYSGSVLVEGNLAVSGAGGNEGALIAYDRKSGDEAWRCGDDPAGYATPYPFTLNGKRYVVGFTGASAIIAEMDSGRLVLRLPWKTDWQVNAAAPILHDGHLLLTSGYTTGCALFKLTPDGDKLSSSTVWQSNVLMNKFQSAILHDGKVYSSDQNALVCADFMTGKEVWREPRIRNGTLILADGQLLLLTEQGQLRIAPVSTEGFKPTTSADILSGRCWTVPILHQGRIYARNLEHTVCFDLRG